MFDTQTLDQKAARMKSGVLKAVFILLFGLGAAQPELVAKFPRSLVGDGADIVVGKGTQNLHYEGELVVIIGKTAKNISSAEAPAAPAS